MSSEAPVEIDVAIIGAGMWDRLCKRASSYRYRWLILLQAGMV